MQERLQKIAESIDWIRMIAVQGDNDIPRSARKAAFIRAPITTIQFGDYLCPHLHGNHSCTIGGTVVDNNDFVDEWRHLPEHLGNPNFFIEARYDYGNAAIFIHPGLTPDIGQTIGIARSSFNRRVESKVNMIRNL